MRHQRFVSRSLFGPSVGLCFIFLSCSVETSVVQRTKRGILQGIVRDGTLGVIEEEPAAPDTGGRQQTGADQSQASTQPQPAKASGRTTYGRGLPGVTVSAFVDGTYKTTTTAKDDPKTAQAGGAVTLEDPQLTIEIDLVKATGQLTVNIYSDSGPAKGARALLDLTGGPLVNTSGQSVSDNRCQVLTFDIWFGLWEKGAAWVGR